MANNGTIILTIDGLDDLLGKLNGNAAEGPINRFLDRGAIYVQGRARSHIQINKSIDTSGLLGSIAVETPEDRVRIIGPTKTYGINVEFGRDPGKMPPAGALLPWMGRHNIDASAEFIIRRAIGKRGITEKPFMRPAAKEGEKFIKGLVPTLASEIEGEYQR